MHKKIVCSALVVCCAFTLYACGGGSTPAPGGSPDFTITVSPGTVTGSAGGSSTAASISIAGLNGFSGNVIVSLTGLLPGSNTTPAQPFAVTAGSGQSLTISIPAGTAPGNVALTVTGTSGTLVHSAGLVLSVTGPVPSSDQIVVVGHTDSGNFPTTPGALAPNPLGGQDGFVFSSRLAGGQATSTFSTYFGGNGAEQVRDLFVDPQGNVYITGQTVSTNIAAVLPAAATAGVLRPTCNACASLPDAFIAKFDASGQILRFTYLGGTGHDEGYNIFVDAAGFIYVGGRTSSSDYPVTAGVAQTTYGGGTFDFHVTRLQPDLSAIVWATFLGGSGEDTGRGRLAVDGLGNVYLDGETRSNNFPGAVGQLRGTRDGVIVKLSPNGALLYTRLIGGNELVNDPEGMTGDLLVKSSGEAYACGFSSASDIAGVIRPFGGGQSDAVIARLDPNGQVLAITYLGGNGLEECQGLALDAAGNLVAAFMTDSTVGFPTTAGAFQSSPQGGLDFAITKFSPDLSAIVFSTLAGGAGNEDADTLRVELDPSGNVYFAGFTASMGIPWITPNALQRNYGGGSHDALLFVLSADGSRMLYASYWGGSGDDKVRSMGYHRNP